jgi:hypothetical protein
MGHNHVAFGERRVGAHGVAEEKDDATLTHEARAEIVPIMRGSITDDANEVRAPADAPPARRVGIGGTLRSPKRRRA